jgi:hypothetical protein
MSRARNIVVGHAARYCRFFWQAYREAKDIIKPTDRKEGYPGAFQFVKAIYRGAIFSGIVFVGPFMLLVALIDVAAIGIPALRHEYEAEKMYPPLLAPDGSRIDLGVSDEGHDVTSTRLP